MRPELPDLAREIIAEIRAKIPEYARPMDGPYGHALQVGVHQALTSFVDWVTDPAAPRERLDQVFRRLGQYEALEGRSLDSLQAACRIGIQVAWRKGMEIGLRHAAPSPVMSWLADAALSYIDELASLARQGYLEVQARSAQSQQQWRGRLLHLILEHPPAPAQAIAELAALTFWAIPAEVTMVALEPGGACAVDLPDDALADLADPQPHVLVPGRVGPGQLPAWLTGSRCAVGLAVPPADAWHSLRWARRALSLRPAGTDPAVVCCEDHLVDLLLLADEHLVEQLARRQLSALHTVRPAHRARLAETLDALLHTRGTAPEMAERLNVHPQTVRYRMHQLEQLLGGPLTDPDTRFAIEVVIRAGALQPGRSAPVQ
jgi:hypothetical protein